VLNTSMSHVVRCAGDTVVLRLTPSLCSTLKASQTLPVCLEFKGQGLLRLQGQMKNISTQLCSGLKSHEHLL